MRKSIIFRNIIFTLLTVFLVIFLTSCKEQIEDTDNNLMWQKEHNGKKSNWNTAKKYCENLTLAGKSDWRLPAKEEYEKLFSKENKSSAMFPGDTENYWTSQEIPPSEAWFAGLYSKQVKSTGKSYSYLARCVRKI